MRDLWAVRLLEALESKARGDQGVQVVGERNVVHADAAADAVIGPVRRFVMPTRPAVRRVHEATPVLVEEHVWPVEAGMYGPNDGEQTERRLGLHLLGRQQQRVEVDIGFGCETVLRCGSFGVRLTGEAILRV